MTELGSDPCELERRRPYLRVLLHALNQPLTAIVNYAEAASASLGDAGDPKLRETLAAARTESRRAVVIARELAGVLGKSRRAESAGLQPNRVLEELAPDLPREAGTRVRLELDRSVGSAAGDAFTLSRALLALVSGGVRALGTTDVTAVLRSRARAGGADIEIFLQGDGPSGAQIAHHGDDLFRDPALALARSSVVDEGGRLVLESADARSLRFLIHLPEA
jgi:C4-dicarboxylate-specific signal transduction histidine kinase